MPASNTKECFRALIGRTVVAVLFDGLPIGSSSDLRAGTKTLVLDDGCGLTIANNGAFWLDSREDVKRAIERRKGELQRLHNDLAEVLRADNVLNQQPKGV